MGQGQADIVIQLLQDCSIKGEWLCLKNLHLVTTWLPTLEKELNPLEPHENFRLWLTTESHPKFPTILLQSSLKVTYEAPLGIKKNLERTYDSWSQEYVAEGSVVRSQALFSLAWFHAMVQERRCHIPQRWSKFYEFSLADMRAAANIIDRLYRASGELCVCVCVHGCVFNILLILMLQIDGIYTTDYTSEARQKIHIMNEYNYHPEEAMNLSAYSLVTWVHPPRNKTNKPPSTSYTTVTTHSNFKGIFPLMCALYY